MFFHRLTFVDVRAQVAENLVAACVQAGLCSKDPMELDMPLKIVK